MFVAVAAAGMLASCSSESLTGSDPEIKTPDQEELVPIEIGVATNQIKASTRGTGTAGGTDVAGDENIWRGERVNVMMYQITNDLPTFNYTQDASSNNLYGNVAMVTPLKVENKYSGLAKEIDSGDPFTTPATAKFKVKYYPSTGRSDFWGYYLGGYGALPAPEASAGAGTLNMYEDAALATAAGSEAAANYVATHFTIDGTHDLMVGKALSVGELTTTTVPASTDPGADAIYSAKAARAGIQPNITFKHLLSRLQFKVKPGKATAEGVTVTGIKIRSLTTGDMIVAYKYTDGSGNPVAEPNRIVWDPTESALAYNARPQLTLKQRNASDEMEDVTPVVLDWITAAEIAAPSAAATELGLTVGDPEQGYPASIGEALLVAPQDKYEIEVDYTVAQASAREWYAAVAPPYDPGAISGGTSPISDKLVGDVIRTTLVGGPGSAAKAFEAGESYLITITLYGPEEIKVTATLTRWISSDQNIEVGMD